MIIILYELKPFSATQISPPTKASGLTKILYQLNVFNILIIPARSIFQIY